MMNAYAAVSFVGHAKAPSPTSMHASTVIVLVVARFCVAVPVGLCVDGARQMQNIVTGINS